MSFMSFMILLERKLKVYLFLLSNLKIIYLILYLQSESKSSIMK